MTCHDDYLLAATGSALMERATRLPLAERALAHVKPANQQHNRERGRQSRQDKFLRAIAIAMGIEQRNSVGGRRIAPVIHDMRTQRTADLAFAVAVGS